MEPEFVHMSNPSLPATAKTPAGPVTKDSFDLVWSKRGWVLADPPADEDYAPPQAPPGPQATGETPGAAPDGELTAEPKPPRPGAGPK